jgi:hypothetical protein
MTEFPDFEWIADQAGVPVSYLIGIPVLLIAVLSLASMMGSKEPENYKIGASSSPKKSNIWLAPLGAFALIAAGLWHHAQQFSPQ